MAGEEDQPLLFARCGLDLEHEAHPWPGGYCDGGAGVKQGVKSEAGPPTTLAGLYGVAPLPRPWAPASLGAELAEEVAGQLAEFADLLNDVYAVDERELLLSCWPRHRPLVLELAALAAVWVEANQSLGATARAALEFHAKHLPEFYGRLRGRGYFGLGEERCRPGRHHDGWRPAARKLGSGTGLVAGVDVEQVVAAVEELRGVPGFVTPEGSAGD